MMLNVDFWVYIFLSPLTVANLVKIYNLYYRLYCHTDLKFAQSSILKS